MDDSDAQLSNETIMAYLVNQLGPVLIDVWNRSKDALAGLPRDYKMVCSLREFARLWNVDQDELIALFGFLRDEDGLWNDVTVTGVPVILPDDKSTLAFAAYRFFNREPLVRPILNYCHSLGKKYHRDTLLFKDRANADLRQPLSGMYLETVPVLNQAT